MGEIADMMLDGTLCCSCGDVLDSEPEGFPVECQNCRRETQHDDKVRRKAANIEHQKRQKKTACPHCGKRVKEVGLSDHIRDVHSQALTEK